MITGLAKRVLAAAAAVMMATVVAACGDGEGKQEGAAGQTANGASASASTSPAAQKQEAGKEADKKDGETRVVKGEFGEVTIPAHPKRVVGVYVEDYLKVLGVTPVVQWYHPTWGKQDYLGLDVPLYDTTGSIEALLAQDPDLIIVDGGVDKAKYEQYSKIAPTYRIPEQVLQNSEEMLKTIADVLNIPEKASKALADYEAKIADAKAKLEKSVGKQTVAVIRVNTGDKTIALFGQKNRYAGEIYRTFGLEPHPLTAKMEEFQQILSEEAFPSLNADHIIVFPSNGDWGSKENQEAFKLLDSPLWKSVPAFANGHVYKVERTHWQSGAITANSMKLDDLLKYMVK